MSTDLDDHDRLILVEEQQRTHWRRYDELRAEIKEHHLEDDRRFADLRTLVETKHAEAIKAIRDEAEKAAAWRDKQTIRTMGILITLVFVLAGVVGNLFLLVK